MKLTQIMLAALATTVLLNCSPKADLNLMPVPGADSSRRDAVSLVPGPTVEGEWTSGCIDNVWSNSGKRILSYKFSSNTFEQNETNYSDAACATTTRSTSTNLKGTFSYVANPTQSTYLVKYIIPINANMWTWRYQNISLSSAGDVLKVTELDVEEKNLAGVAPKIELRKKAALSSPSTAPAAGAGGSLQSGFYRPAPNSSQVCDQVVSTMDVNGVVQSVYVDLQRPCTPTTLTLDCNKGVCESSRFSLKILSSSSYEFTSLNGGWNVTFSKR